MPEGTSKPSDGWTAHGWGASTFRSRRRIGSLSQPGGPLFNIEVSNGGLITFPGGIPLRDGNGEVVGGVGVSGSSVDNDHAVAEAGAKALG